MGFDYQQVIGIEVNKGILPERVAVAARQVEVQPGLCLFGCSVVGRICAVEGLSGRNPPMIVGVACGEAGVSFEGLA